MQNIDAQNRAATLNNCDFYSTDVYLNSKLIRIEDVADLTTLGKSTINLWVAQNKFPKPVLLSPTLKVWRFGDVTAWIETAINGGENV